MTTLMPRRTRGQRRYYFPDHLVEPAFRFFAFSSWRLELGVVSTAFQLWFYSLGSCRWLMFHLLLERDRRDG
jgi:hypothetical protein